MSDNPIFQVSDNALKRISSLLSAKQDSPLYFRVGISPGGCSGFEYQFKLEGPDDLCSEDAIFEHVYGDQTLRVVIHPKSLALLKGAQLDYKEQLHASRFEVNNPNAQGACGCGISFCLKTR